MLAAINPALEALVSGIPVAVVGRVPEDAFFAWVDALADALPPELAALLSAGWGVPPGLAEALAVIATWETPAMARALHLPERWEEPAQLVVAHRGVRETVPFRPDRLLPGRVWTESRSPIRATVRLNSAIPGFLEADIGRAFRRLGTASVDEARLERLEGWMSGHEDSRALSLIRDLALRESRDRASCLLAQDGPRRVEVAQWFWGELASGRWEWLGRFGSLGESPVFGLMLALHARNASKIRAFLHHSDIWDALPMEALPRLEAALNDVLIDFANDTLVAVTSAITAGERWRLWVTAHATRIATRLFDAGSYGTLRELSECTGLAIYSLFEAVGAMRPPTTHEYSMVATLGTAAANALGSRVSSRWDRSSAEERAVLFLWATAVGQERLVSSSTLRSIFGPPLIPDYKVISVFDDALAGRLPSNALPYVAALALDRWPIAGPRLRADMSGSVGVRRCLPSVAQSLLFPEVIPEVSEVAALPTVAAWERLRLTTAGIDSLASNLLDGPTHVPEGVADALWSKALTCIMELGSPLGIAALALAVSQRELPDGGPPGAGVVRRFLRLVWEAGRTEEVAAAAIHWWGRNRTGWQDLVVLQVVEPRELLPRREHLVRLMPSGARVAELLHGRQDVDPGFAYVTAGLGAQAWVSRDLSWWAQLSGTPLWSAWSGVPVACQGSVYDALATWSSLPGEQIALATRYLTGQQDDRGPCVERSLRAVIRLAVHPKVALDQLVSVVDAVARQRETSPGAAVRAALNGPVRVGFYDVPPASPGVYPGHGEIVASEAMRQFLRVCITAVGVDEVRRMVRAKTGTR